MPAEDSGHEFAAMLQARAASLGVEVRVDVYAHAAPGSYAVWVDWQADEVGVLFEVDDLAEGVRLLDPDGEDVTVEEAVDYFAARLSGCSPREAMAAVSPPKLARPWWRRGRA